MAKDDANHKSSEGIMRGHKFHGLSGSQKGSSTAAKGAEVKGIKMEKGKSSQNTLSKKGPKHQSGSHKGNKRGY